MQPQRMSIKTPEILWSGGNDNGKPNPVFAVDMLPLMSSDGTVVLCTSGTDGSTPTKGSARVWKIVANLDTPTALLDLNDHQSAVHSARFSPCGTMLATASDRMIIVYTVPSAESWETTTEEKSLARSYLRPHLQEIYDLRWSPDCRHIIAGSIDCKAEILRVIDNRVSIDLPGHTSYVQGVAWDPLGKFAVTQSADRSCKSFTLRSMANGAVKLQSRGGVSTMKMAYAPNAALSVAPADKGTEEQTQASAIKSSHLFADDTIASFFRRPDFCPDGAILVCPAGLYRPVPGTSSISQSFCCHVFSRNQMTYPIASLAGLEDAAIAVRFSPLLYQMIDHMSSSASAAGSDTEALSLKAKVGYMQGDYRYVFAVATTTSVFVYDTQHSHPIVRITGCHLATINDVAWSIDGNILTCCSSDGYVTIIKFEPGSLGLSVDVSDIPSSVKCAHPCQYGVSAEDIAAEKLDSKADGLDEKEDNDPEDKSEPYAAVDSGISATPLTETPSISNGASETESAKKKRRICPTPLGDVGPVKFGLAFQNEITAAVASGAEAAPAALTDKTVPVEVQLLNGDGIPGHLEATSTAPTKKTKKRIAPVLVLNPPA